MNTTQARRHAGTQARSALGFSIVEVMFAIMILGIGFILVAAMFPVAIQQTQATVDETRARVAAQNGVSSLTMAFRNLSVGNKLLENAHPAYAVGFPAALTAPPPATAFQELYQSIQIDVANPRYAWTALYHYDAAGAPGTLNVYPVGLVSTVNAEFSPTDAPLLIAQSVPVLTFTPAGSPPRVQFTDPVGQAIAVEGALIFDPIAGVPYRLANLFDPATNTWELVGNAVPANSPVYIIGRWYSGGVASGPNQVRYAPTLPIAVSVN